jgi:pimeloyl-ACP methyl ester carboxylesterase
MAKKRIQHPVIFIPGITGTSLHDDYPLKTVDLWTMILNHDYQRISLHPDNMRYEAIEPARVYVGRLFSIYNEFIEALRHELSPAADQPTPVFAFPYDWRRDVRDTAAELRDFIEEVIARTELLRHYDGYANVRKVDLVAHSMGGLLVCEYLSQLGHEKRVGKVATVGTPFAGSIEAVLKLTVGLGVLSYAKPNERERESARSTPAVYQLLPSYPGSVVSPEGNALDVFDPANWQQSVVDSLSEYVRLHSVRDHSPKSRRTAKARAMLKSLLDGARASRATADKLSLPGTGLKKEDWLAVIGADDKTRQQVQIVTRGRKPYFDLDVAKPINEWPDSRATGDGTVPLNGALPRFLPETALVAVRPDDFGFFEIGDRLMLPAAGFHAVLTSMNLVQRLVTKHLMPKFKGRIDAQPIPGVARKDWKPPLKGLK